MFGCSPGFFFHWGGWFTAFVLVAAGFLTAWLILKNSGKKAMRADRLDSLEILKARLARGDITLEEYNTLKSVL